MPKYYNISNLKLYHTLYLIKPKVEIISELDSKKYNDLKELVEKISSNSQLQQLSFMLNISTNQIINYASYLIKKGYVKYGHPIDDYCHFRVSEKVLIDSNSELLFNKEFQTYNITLSEILSYFKPGLSLNEIKQFKKHNFSLNNIIV